MAGKRDASLSALAVVAVAICTVIAAPLFVQPSALGTQAPPALRASIGRQPQAETARLGNLGTGVVSCAGFGLVSLALLAALRSARANPMPRTSRLQLRAAPEAASFDPSKQLGAMEPLGFFDPAGFSKVGDKEGFFNLRVAELKHGRVAMMAALGGVVQHYVKFPGFDDVPAGLGAVTTAPGMYGFVALFLVSGALELAVWTQDPNKEPGDFGDPVGFGMYDMDMRAKELNNGRFAMFAALGIVAADLLTGKDAVQQLGI